MNSPDEPTAAHLDTELIAAYLDRALSAAETTQAEEHLADCARCRRELTDAARVLRLRSRRRHWIVAAPVTAAAAAALILLFAVPANQVDPAGDVRRGDVDPVEDESLLSIDAISPSPGAVIDRSPIVFVWRPFDEDAVYRITVADENGDIVWTIAISDTAIALPADVRLTPDRTYLWYVDSLRRDIRSATTGVREFRTAP